MRKKILTVVALLLFLSTVQAYDLNACRNLDDFNKMGNCIIRGSFSGDPLLFSIIMIGAFAIFMAYARMPQGAAIGLSLIVFFALGDSLGVHYTLLLNLAILTIGIMIGLTILHFIKN